MNYSNTPGVKIKEVSLLPPSIVQVSTAIPVFLGYTAEGPVKDPVRISSLNEYEAVFGGAYKHGYEIVEDSVAETITVTKITTSAEFGTFFFYEAIKAYFLNGGGACHIISVALHGSKTAVNVSDFEAGMALIDKMDEPTIIAFPEATGLSMNKYKTVTDAALLVADNTKDKFVLMDTPNGVNLLGSDLSTFRDKLTGSLSYGAVYYPSVEMGMIYGIDEVNSTYKLDGAAAAGLSTISTSQNYTKALTILENEQTFTLPPSTLVAGVYASVDRNRGFWKAPANIALQGVIKPSVAISDGQQELLNVDADSGKSINAIRAFAGKGNLIWGARTLDGNNNEWRYISVRRLFMTVEESVKKATAQFVFENNDSQTWTKVASMISAYLNGLWREGALAGASPEEAFFVQVGLGTTMTETDVQNGKMIVKIGLAAVRPAEFITLEFFHKVGQ